MNERIVKLRSRVEGLERDLKDAQAELAHVERNCHHSWGETQNAHIYTEGYTIPGDPPGTMGVDWRGPCDVPAKTEKRWKRSCKICGLVQFTSHTTQSVVDHPIF